MAVRGGREGGEAAGSTRRRADGGGILSQVVSDELVGLTLERRNDRSENVHRMFTGVGVE
jgi:hypothetical protein